VSLAAAIRNEDAMRERRCIVTGETRGEARLIRFVVGPDDTIVPDLAARLPGRGIWVTAERAMLEKAPFAKAAKKKVSVPIGLADTVEKLIARRMMDDLGLARRSGAAVAGFDSVVRALEGPRPPVVLVEASDGAMDGRRKLANLAAARGLRPAVVDGLSSAELSVALGRENVIHAALTSGQLAERLIFEAGRLSGFRIALKDRAGSNPAHEGM
jgi:predicted RNA-binding protein YlxR (DUF448 family)